MRNPHGTPVLHYCNRKRDALGVGNSLGSMAVASVTAGNGRHVFLRCPLTPWVPPWQPTEARTWGRSWNHHIDKEPTESRNMANRLYLCSGCTVLIFMGNGFALMFWTRAKRKYLNTVVLIANNLFFIHFWGQCGAVHDTGPWYQGQQSGRCLRWRPLPVPL